MEKIHTKKFYGTPFIITASSVDNGPGVWQSLKVSIYRDENLVGEYIRNYGDFGPMTFFPFQIGNDWYALYSASYTATRVMKIHEDRIEDWCGEEAVSHGFCPVEYYIPRYNIMKGTVEISGKVNEFTTCGVDTEYENIEEFIAEWKDPNFVETQFCNFAFMCGCVWGDDTSWKLRYIDLSQIPDKVLTISEKFGYWELPGNMTLRKCINMSGWEPDHPWIELTKMEHVNLVTGERC